MKIKSKKLLYDVTSAYEQGKIKYKRLMLLNTGYLNVLLRRFGVFAVFLSFNFIDYHQLLTWG